MPVTCLILIKVGYEASDAPFFSYHEAPANLRLPDAQGTSYLGGQETRILRNNSQYIHQIMQPLFLRPLICNLCIFCETWHNGRGFHQAQPWTTTACFLIEINRLIIAKILENQATHAMFQCTGELNRQRVDYLAQPVKNEYFPTAIVL